MFKLLTFLFLTLPGLVLAQDTDFGSVRLLNGWRTADGDYQFGLAFDLNPGWKTYWRAPGSGGIPPRFDWTGSRNIGAVEVTWPAPHVFDTAGINTIGYKGSFVLPIRITPEQDGAVRVALNLEFGVCSTICIPAEKLFLARLDGDRIEGQAAIAQALQAVPEPARRAGLRDISCAIEPTDSGFRITASLRTRQRLQDPVVVIEYNDPDVWISESVMTLQGRSISAQADLRNYGAGPLLLNRDDLRVTVLADGTAAESNGCPG